MGDALQGAMSASLRMARRGSTKQTLPLAAAATDGGGAAAVAVAAAPDISIAPTGGGCGNNEAGAADGVDGVDGGDEVAARR